MSIKNAVIGFILHTGSWLLGTVITETLFSSSSARTALGVLAGWWCALYIGYILKIKIEASLIVISFYLLVAILAVLFNWEWFYHDLPNQLSFLHLLMMFLGGCLFSTPIFINALLSYVIQKIPTRFQPR